MAMLQRLARYRQLDRLLLDPDYPANTDVGFLLRRPLSWVRPAGAILAGRYTVLRVADCE